MAFVERQYGAIMARYYERPERPPQKCRVCGKPCKHWVYWFAPDYATSTISGCHSRHFNCMSDECAGAVAKWLTIQFEHGTEYQRERRGCHIEGGECPLHRWVTSSAETAAPEQELPPDPRL